MSDPLDRLAASVASDAIREEQMVEDEVVEIRIAQGPDFVQEDSPEEIGDAVADFVDRL